MILCSEYGGQPNTIICSFVCDSVDEIKDLPTTKKLGSGSFCRFQPLCKYWFDSNYWQ